MPAQIDEPGILCISRNKHLKHISAYHGPWLRLDHEFLVELLQHNNTQKSRSIHHGVLEDIITIRKLVDEAVALAVRASSQQSVTGRGTLSKERRYRMNVLAIQKLAKAYTLNEIAASVATMQSASALEETAAKVLQRTPNDVDALYVHFFHERIPSRQLAESTTLDTLDLLIRARPMDAHLLRTRANILCFKNDHLNAIKDLTAAIQLIDHYHEKTGSLESQLLFLRGETYLAHAVHLIPETIKSKENKRVRQHAKKAIKDILKFCSLIEYRDEKVTTLNRLFTAEVKAIADVPEKPSREEVIKQVASLKARKLLDSGTIKTTAEFSNLLESITTSTTTVTYHPLLPDALHLLLLAHTLLSPTKADLQRYSSTVLHILGLLDGYPVFQLPRSSARSDWSEVLKFKGDDLLGTTKWHRIAQGEEQVNEYPVSDRAGLIVDWLDYVN